MFLHRQPETLGRFERVASLIDGFETPYGLELLSSAHWVATNELPAAEHGAAAVVRGVHAWRPRKAKLFHEPHIVRAWERLREGRWI